MLQAIRDKSQGWIVWTIVILICAVFALWGIRSYLYHNQAQDVVVNVNGTKITHQEYSVAYNQLQRQAQLQAGVHYKSSPALSKKLKHAALQSLISNVVLTQAATKAGFAVAPELVEIALAKMPIFQVNGAFSKARFMQILQSLLYSPNQFLQQLRHDMLIGQVKNGITQTAFVLPREINTMLALVNQKRAFSYVIVPMSRFMTKIKLAPQAAMTYYKTHQDEFKLPEKVSISYLQLSMTDLMAKIKPSNALLKQFYQNNISSYTIPEKWRLASILIATPYDAAHHKNAIKKAQTKIQMIAKQLEARKDFNALRKKYSEDAQANLDQKQLPWTNIGQLGPELRTVIPRMHIGDVSAPIKTSRGFEIIKVLAKKPAKVEPFAQVQKRVLQMYQQRHAEQQFSNLSDQLANITYEKPHSLKPAAKQLGLTIHTTSFFTKQGAKTGLTAKPQIVTAAFSDNVLAENNNSDPVNLNDNSVVILRVTKHIPAKIKPFNEVKANIEKQLKTDEAKKETSQLGDKILAALNKTHDLKILAQKNQLTLHTVSPIVRHDLHHKINSEILTKVFLMPKPSQKQKAVNAGINLQSGDFAILALTSVQNKHLKNITPIQKHAFKEGFRNALGQIDYNLYVQNLMKKASIKHYEDKQDNI